MANLKPTAPARPSFTPTNFGAGNSFSRQKSVNSTSNFGSNTNTISPTNFGTSNSSVYQTQNFGQKIQENNNVKGAFGNWGNNSHIPTPTQNPSNFGPNNFQSSPNTHKTIVSNSSPTPLTSLNPNLRSNLDTNFSPNNRSNFPNISSIPSNQSPNGRNNISPFTRSNPVPNNSSRPNNFNPTTDFSPNNRPVNPRIGTNLAAQTPVKSTSKKGFFAGLFGNSTPVKPVVLDKNSPKYLKTLTPSQLRQEVIKTEIEIQKTLIESEKAYREGISTIKDLIAPSSVKITGKYMELGTKIVRSFFVLTYPRVINGGWLEGIVNADVPMDLSIYVYPRDSSQVLRELKGKVGKIQASLQLNSEKGAARDPELETAYRDVEGLRDAISQGVEKFFRVGIYITVYADNEDQLVKHSEMVEGILSQQSIIMKRAALQMDDGFNSTLPIMKDDLDVLNNMNTSPLSACFPFVSSELSSDSGILYGINRHNSSLIIFDRFELENANSLVFATSGAGKSYAVKLEILRSLMIGVSVIVIDPEQEYKVLADTLGGAYINMSLNSNNRINPFDLPKPLPGESNADILRTAIIDLMGLMNLMLGKLNPQEVSTMERAIQECYAKRDITAESDFATINPPTMGDLVEILNGIVGGESMAQRLYRYTQGTFAGIFNQRTNINISNGLVVFNIRDLQEQLRPIAMYILLKYVWNEIRSELKRRILAIDEAWIMMQYEDSARFLYGLVKRARKYYLGVTTITQDVGDFLSSPFGKPIVTNAAMKLLLKQSTAAIDQVSETFALTTGEKQVLLQSEVGQGIFFAGPKHVAIEIIAFPTEHKVITTNPKDVLKMQGLEN
jgi:conjugal transfer ATP-binding protein TraC